MTARANGTVVAFVNGIMISTCDFVRRVANNEVGLNDDDDDVVVVEVEHDDDVEGGVADSVCNN